MKNRIKYGAGLFAGAILIAIFIPDVGFMFGVFWGLIWTSYARDSGWI